MRKEGRRKNPFTLLIILGVIPLALGFLGKWNWILDLFSHFRVYYAIYFALVAVSAFLFKQRKEGVIALLILLFLVSSLFRFYLPIHVESDISSNSIKVGSINLLSANQNYEQVLSYVNDEDFDVIFFLEVNVAWERQLNTLIEDFDHSFFVTRADNFGIGVLSRIEPIEIEEINLSAVNIPSILMKFSFYEKELTILGTHPLPPIGKTYFEARNKQFEQINDFLKNSEGEVVLIGDLNSTVFSPNFKRVAKNVELKDTRQGFGLLPTWHADLGLVDLTLDHILVSEGIAVLNRGIGPNIGSDHLPVYAELGFNE